MKKFIIQSAAFILFLSVFLCVGVIVWGTFFPYLLKKNIKYHPAAYGHMYSRIKDVSATKNVDILFIGSSVCYRGFDTRIFQQHGYSAFNLGSSNQTHLQSEVLLKHYLQALQPKLVVYEVSPIVLSADGVESALDIISNDKIDFASLQMALRINNTKVYSSLLYAYFKQLTAKNQNLSEPAIRDSIKYIQGGYEESPMQFFISDSVFPSRNYSLAKTQVNSFLRNLQFLQSHNIPYILVQAPNTKAVYKTIQNTSQIDSLYNASGTYFNFNTVPDFSDTLHFYDFNHLNQQGVILFNKKIISILDTLKLK